MCLKFGFVNLKKGVELENHFLEDVFKEVFRPKRKKSPNNGRRKIPFKPKKLMEFRI